MSLKASSTIDHAKRHLPGNFDGLRVISTAVEDAIITHELGCQCGGTAGVVNATPYDDGEFLDPVSFACLTCGQAVTFFDSNRDGYNGRLNGGASYPQGAQEATTTCLTCGSSSAQLRCSLAYNIDFEAEDEAELLEDAQNYFDAIDIHARCVQCGADRPIGAWELA